MVFAYMFQLGRIFYFEQALYDFDEGYLLSLMFEICVLKEFTIPCACKRIKTSNYRKKKEEKNLL